MRDPYHACYALSGAAIAQQLNGGVHFAIDGLGAPLVRPASVCTPPPWVERPKLANAPGARVQWPRAWGLVTQAVVDPAYNVVADRLAAARAFYRA